jgi:hypothetical protein
MSNGRREERREENANAKFKNQRYLPTLPWICESSLSIKMSNLTYLEPEPEKEPSPPFLLLPYPGIRRRSWVSNQLINQLTR